MTFSFARRIHHAPASFLGELFRVSADPSIISFAGGLPSSALIDAEGLSEAARDVFSTDPRTALQYSTTDGYRPLRSTSLHGTRGGSGSPQRPTRSRSPTAPSSASTSSRRSS